MIEQTEMVYRWNRGESKAAIARSLGVGRKTVRKYVSLAIDAGLSQETPLPEDKEIAKRLNPVKQSRTLATQPTPVQDRLVPYDTQ